MNIELDDWQKEALAHKGNLLLCTGRQVGKTYILSRKAAERMIERKTAILVGSLTEDQAKLIITMTLIYLEQNYKKHIASGKRKPTMNKITLKNGSTILARPVGNTGDALRGFTGDVFIPDEMSRMPEMAFTAGLPTLLTTGGEIWGASTPFGKKGYFYECFLNKEEFWKVIHISSEEVLKNRKLSETWTQERKDRAIAFLERQKAEMSELQYGQEYLGLFLEDLRRFFDDELINKICILQRQPKSPKEENYMGVDIARLGGDESAYEILNAVDPERIRQVENIVEKYKLTTHTENKIRELTRIWKLRKSGIDAGSGSLGVGIYDHLLLHPETKRKVVPMNNRQISLDREGKIKQRLFKEDLYDNLKAMMEHKEIFLLDDDNIIASLSSIQYEFVKSQGEITKVRIFGRYSHIAEGLIRAAWLAKKERHKKFFIHTI